MVYLCVAGEVIVTMDKENKGQKGVTNTHGRVENKSDRRYEMSKDANGHNYEFEFISELTEIDGRRREVKHEITHTVDITLEGSDGGKGVIEWDQEREDGLTEDIRDKIAAALLLAMLIAGCVGFIFGVAVADKNVKQMIEKECK